jgi:hypothetical protein
MTPTWTPDAPKAAAKRAANGHQFVEAIRALNSTLQLLLLVLNLVWS